MPSISSPSFARLVAALKRHQKTCTVIESSCGGLINASILAQPGASQVYYGGSVAYNTKKAKPFLLNNPELHLALTTPPSTHNTAQSEKETYIQSKLEWTKQTAIAFCCEVGTDFCIAEGGATGPTFRPKDLTTGFAVVAVAAKQSNGQVQLVQQQVLESTHNIREENMRQFADQAAELAYQVVTKGEEGISTAEDISSSPSTSLKHLDRGTHFRSNPETMAQFAKEAHYVVLHGSTALFRKPVELHNRELCLLSQSQVQAVGNALQAKLETSFLGLLNGKEPIFGVDLLVQGDSSMAAVETAIAQVLNGTEEVLLEDIRTVAPLLDSCHNEMVLHATALAQWQRRAPFCSVCGSSTILVEGGTSRTCTGCGHRSWPRQDPSMIAVVSNRDGTKVLLGRSARHPTKMYTALAGFVEAGETMERAVAREVYEETGIRVDEDTVEYVASQPWPFPQSTMIGFTVQADESQPIQFDPNELVDAQWFDRSQVMMASSVLGPVMQKEVAEAALAANPDLSLLIPPKGVLARKLIDKWLCSSKTS